MFLLSHRKPCSSNSRKQSKMMPTQPSMTGFSSRQEPTIGKQQPVMANNSFPLPFLPHSNSSSAASRSGDTSNQVSHIHCGNCRTTLMYPYGAPSVKCAICHYITNVNRPSGTTNSETVSSTPTSMPNSQSQTVVVENPMSVDSSGKLVSNVVVGVTTDKK